MKLYGLSLASGRQFSLCCLHKACVTLILLAGSYWQGGLELIVQLKKCKIVLLARWTRIKHKFYSKLTSKYSVSHVSDFYSSRQRKKFEKKTKKFQNFVSIFLKFDFIKLFDAYTPVVCSRLKQTQCCCCLTKILFTTNFCFYTISDFYSTKVKNLFLSFIFTKSKI